MVDLSKNKPFVVLKDYVKDKPLSGWRDTFLEEAIKHFNVVSHQQVLDNVAIAQEIVGAFIKPPPASDVAWLHENLNSLYRNVKIICNHSVGLDHLNFELYREKQIRVAYTPGAVSDATADCAMALMLASARNFKEAMAEAIGPRPQTGFNTNFLGVDVCFASLGIVGMGGIGMKIAKRAKAFDMTIHYHNRNRRQEEESEFGAKYYSTLHEMLPLCDFVIISCPQTKETTNLFGKKEFELMKSTATIINVSRGPVVNTDSLVDALQNKSIRAAGLDVTHPEPLPLDHPLLKMDNVIVIPHHGTATHQTRLRMEMLLITNMIEGLQGKEMQTEHKF